MVESSNSGYVPEGRTRLFDETNLEIDGSVHRLISLGAEATEPGYGYAVEVFKFEEDDSKDAAKATIFPNSWFPPEQVLRDGIVDYPTRGRGEVIVYTPDGNLQRISYDETNPEHGNLRIVYPKGSYICGRAFTEGLEFVEICQPPYKEGDLKILDISANDIPLAFREAYLALIKPA